MSCMEARLSVARRDAHSHGSDRRRRLAPFEYNLIAAQTGTRRAVVVGEADGKDSRGNHVTLPAEMGYTIAVPQPRPYPYHATQNIHGAQKIEDAMRENLEYLQQEAKRSAIRYAEIERKLRGRPQKHG